MARVVQLMSVSDGQLVLDQSALGRTLLAEHSKHQPVVVLAAMGARGAQLMTSLLHRISADAPGGTQTPTACFPASGSGPAGVLMWPQLLPVQLPSGAAAGALLLSAWGALDSCCPGGAAVLSVTALLSSVLVVSMSEHGSGGLQRLGQLASLASAAAAVDHCSPLQQAVFVVHDWRGAAPGGRQRSFEPLEGWAQKSVVCRDALIAMHTASDWYQRVTLFLEPLKGVAAVANPLYQSETVTAGIDPAVELVSTMAAKTFNTEPLLAGDLLQHFTRLVGTSPSCSESPPNPAPLIDVLMDLSKQRALRRAEQVYRDHLSAGWDPAQLDNFRLCHQRAAHEARLAFMTAVKMAYRDSEAGDDDTALSARCDHIYQQQLELLHTKASQLRSEAESRNIELQDICIKHYKDSMEHQTRGTSLMSLPSFMSLHDQSQRETLAKFDTGRNQFGGAGSEERQYLYDQIQSMFRVCMDRHSALLQQIQADERNIESVVDRAVSHYVTIMEAIQPPKQTLHRTVQEGALALCESSKLLISNAAKANAGIKVRAKTDAELRRITDRHQAATNQDAYNPAVFTRPLPPTQTESNNTTRAGKFKGFFGFT